MNHIFFSSWSFIYKKWSYPQSNSFKLNIKTVNFPLWKYKKYDHTKTNEKRKTEYLQIQEFKLNCVVCVSTYVTIKAEAERNERRKKPSA